MIDKDTANIVPAERKPGYYWINYMPYYADKYDWVIALWAKDAFDDWGWIDSTGPIYKGDVIEIDENQIVRPNN